MKIYIGTDHAGYELKETLKKFLTELGYEVKDFGAFQFDKDDDYPDFVKLVAEEVSKDPDNFKGVIIGASGQGEAIVANRFKNVRATVYYGGDLEIVWLSRAHNNSNVLSLGARFLTEDEAKRAVDVWLKTPFNGGRHERRIEKIDI